MERSWLCPGQRGDARLSVCHGRDGDLFGSAVMGCKGPCGSPEEAAKRSGQASWRRRGSGAEPEGRVWQLEVARRLREECCRPWNCLSPGGEGGLASVGVFSPELQGEARGAAPLSATAVTLASCHVHATSTFCTWPCLGWGLQRGADPLNLTGS